MRSTRVQFWQRLIFQGNATLSTQLQVILPGGQHCRPGLGRLPCDATYSHKMGDKTSQRAKHSPRPNSPPSSKDLFSALTAKYLLQTHAARAEHHKGIPSSKQQQQPASNLCATPSRLWLPLPPRCEAQLQWRSTIQPACKRPFSELTNIRLLPKPRW